MLLELLEKSLNRSDCANNYLMPRLMQIISVLREVEKSAKKDYRNVFNNCKKLPKNTFLLQEGQIASNFWFMEEGIARQYFIRNGNQVCNDIFFPCEFIDSYGTSSLGLPSKVNIQLITDSIVRIINYEALRKLETKYPILWQAEQLTAACNIIWLEERLYELQNLTATERYRALLHKQPQLIKKIPLSYIASYLGMKLETLSRIRAKIKIQ
jgi:CRP-like cAMP-binding protein